MNTDQRTKYVSPKRWLLAGASLAALAVVSQYLGYLRLRHYFRMMGHDYLLASQWPHSWRELSYLTRIFVMATAACIGMGLYFLSKIRVYPRKSAVKKF
jgi:hypothetical protein